MKLELYYCTTTIPCKEMTEGMTSGFALRMKFRRLKTEVDMHYGSRSITLQYLLCKPGRPRNLAVEVDRIVPTVGLEGMKTTYSILSTIAVVLVAEV